MHHCPKCHQELNDFAFYCPRCKRPVGELAVEGDLLSVWWLDIDANHEKKQALKALKRGGESLNLISVHPKRPDASTSIIDFTARTVSGTPVNFKRAVSDVFAELQQASQEWEVE